MYYSVYYIKKYPITPQIARHPQNNSIKTQCWVSDNRELEG